MSDYQNILILGHSGFVGRALVRRLKKAGDNLILASKDGAQSEDSADFFGDLKDKNFCERIIKGIDLVYYLAGCKKNISYHTSQPFYFFAENTVPLAVFLEVMKSSEVKKMVYLSSIIVDYAGADTGDGYVLGKYANELMLKVFSAEFPDIQIVVLKSAPIYGPGDNFNQETANFIPSIINKVEGSDGAVQVWGSGKRKLQFIYIDDLVENLMAASNAPSAGVYKIGNDETKTVAEITKLIIKKFGKQLRLEFNTEKPDKPTNLAVFNNLVAPAYNLEQGIGETIKYFREFIK